MNDDFLMVNTEFLLFNDVRFSSVTVNTVNKKVNNVNGYLVTDP